MPVVDPGVEVQDDVDDLRPEQKRPETFRTSDGERLREAEKGKLLRTDDKSRRRHRGNAAKGRESRGEKAEKRRRKGGGKAEARGALTNIMSTIVASHHTSEKFSVSTCLKIRKKKRSEKRPCCGRPHPG